MGAGASCAEVSDDAKTLMFDLVARCPEAREAVLRELNCDNVLNNMNEDDLAQVEKTMLLIASTSAISKNSSHVPEVDEGTAAWSASGQIKEKRASRGRLSVPKVKAVRVWTANAGNNTDLLRKCIKKLGWEEETRSEGRKYCNILWLSKHLDKMHLSSKQIVNRIDGMRELTDKVSTEQCLRLCRECGLQGFEVSKKNQPNFFLKTWLLPEERNEVQEYLQKNRGRRGSKQEKEKGSTIIFKPATGSEGNGILLVKNASRLPSVDVARPAVTQQYVTPMLWQGYKFDLRIYVLVRSVDPLSVYVHREGLARFCTEHYEAPREENLHKAFAHLTNYSLNKKSDAFVAHCHLDADAEPQADDFSGASKQPASSLIRALAATDAINGDSDAMWAKIDRLCALTCIALQPELMLRHRSRFLPQRSSLDSAVNDSSSVRFRAFQILGFDVLLDANGVPTLLEVNSNPSLGIDVEISTSEEVDSKIARQESPVDVYVKRQVVSDMLHLVATTQNSSKGRLRAVIGDEAPAPPPELNLLARAGQLYDATLLKPLDGMNFSHFLRFARESGLLNLSTVHKADLENLFIRLCAQQPWEPDQPSQKVMRFPAFVRTLLAVSEKARSVLFDSNVDEGTLSLALLLDYIEAQRRR